MEQRRWLAVAVLMCLLVLCSGRGGLLALLWSSRFSLPERKKIVFWIGFPYRFVQADSACRLIFLSLCIAHFIRFLFYPYLLDSELKTKHVPIYDPVLARTLAEYTSAVSSPDLLDAVIIHIHIHVGLCYCWIRPFSSEICCIHRGVELGAFVQVYTADLTQLFTWTCERCCDLTEVFYICHHHLTFYNFTNGFQVHIWLGLKSSLNLFGSSGVRGDRADCWCEKLLTGYCFCQCTWTVFFLPSNRLLIILMMIVFMMSQAYVGFARDMNAVIVVFRGTQENR